MKDLVQCRKLEAKFRQLAVSDPARRFLWLAEAEKWNGRPKRKSLLTSKHAMPCERPLQSSQSPQNLVHAPEGGALIASGFTARVGRAGGARTRASSAVVEP
jgi:hypothetical protein